MDYSRFINKRSSVPRDNPIRVLGQAFLKNPTLISLSGGIPHPSTFPFVEADVTLRDGTVLHMDHASFKYALQYTQTRGFPKLVEWVKEFQKRIHNPPTCGVEDNPGKMECMLVSGNADGIAKAIEMLVDEGDNVLIEQPTYPPPGLLLRSLFCNMISVHCDLYGLNPNSLRQVLSKWTTEDIKNTGSGIPKVLYCIPTAQNPLGATLSLERKRDIYKIAQDYDLLILEDDPYYFLQFSETRVPSFLSMDVDGRVLRFDSFSKIVSAGMRVGVVTGPAPLIQKLEESQALSTFQPSGISQMFLYNFLDKLGFDGFKNHLNIIRDFYKEKRNMCVKTADEHLKGLAEWVAPNGGMFMWINLLNVSDSSKIISKALEKNVSFLAGKNMFINEQDKPHPYIRVSYSTVSAKEMDTAFSVLADLLRSLADQQ